jgi:hypothetical protein
LLHTQRAVVGRISITLVSIWASITVMGGNFMYTIYRISAYYIRSCKPNTFDTREYDLPRCYL